METRAIHELHRLVSALLDDRLDDEGRLRLGELLRGDADARELYLSYCDLHVELAAIDTAWQAVGPQIAEQRDVVAAEPVPSHQVAKPRRRRAMSRRLLWSALALMFAAWVPVVWLLTSPDGPPAIAEIVAEDAAEWAEGFSSEELLSASELRLLSGQARLRMMSGAEVTLAGPAAIELLDPKAIRIVSGRVAVRVVDEGGIGFRVVTPTADVVDLGTEFGIEVDSSGATEVHVADGVVVARPSGSTGVVPIMQREAARFDTMHGELATIGFDARRFPSFAPKRQSSFVPRESEHYAPLPSGARVVFLGDRLTDLETHILLVNQALAELPDAERPRLFNAGETFSLQFEEREFVEHVESFRPTHAVLEFNPLVTNSSSWSPEAASVAVLRLVNRLEAAGIEPIVETGFALDANASLAEFNGFLRKLAAERGYRLADAEAAAEMDSSGADLMSVSEKGRGRPTFQGYRRIAAAVLESLGWSELEVGEAIVPVMLPGVVTDWRYRHVGPDDPALLDAQTVRSLDPADWEPLRLPQPIDPIAKRLHEESHLVSYRDRERGFATSLFGRDSQGVVATTTIESQDDRDVFINVGATVRAVWLNGERITPPEHLHGWHGWHAGRHRIPVRLEAGLNEIVVESGAYFFVSVTEKRDWPLPVPSVESLVATEGGGES